MAGGAAQPGDLELAPGVRVPSAVVEFTFVQSSGPGGQNVNKRATRARMRVSVEDIPISFGARNRLIEIAGQQATDGGEIVIASDEHRTQRRNREACLERLREMIVRAKVVPKVRKKTRPSRGAVMRRLEEKRRRGEIKRRRRGPEA